MRHRRVPSRLLGPTEAVLILATGISLAGLDRPVAAYMQRAFHSPALFQWAGRFFFLLLACGAVLAGLGAGLGWLALRGSLRPSMNPMLVSSAAGVAALIASEVLKFVFGRSQAYPAFLVDGIYRFAPFHWGGGYGSFPSTTAAATTAVLGVLWVSRPGARPLYAALLVLVCAAILMVNAHWLSDLLAGCLLGSIMASICMRFRRV